jgi:hypothetical protein
MAAEAAEKEKVKGKEETEVVVADKIGISARA